MSASAKLNAHDAVSDGFRANHLYALLGYCALLEEYLESENDESEAFQMIIHDAHHRFEIKPLMFSDEFGVHPSTVMRWELGKSQPSQTIKPHIVKWLLTCVEKQIEALRVSPASLGKLNRKVHEKLDTMTNREPALASG